MADETGKFLDRAERVIAEAHKIEEAVTAANISLSRGRRRLILLWLLAVVVAINVHDLHVRHCMVQGQPDTKLEQTACNLTFPSHSHLPTAGTEAESHLQIVGLLVWAGIIGGVAVWHLSKNASERKALTHPDDPGG